MAKWLLALILLFLLIGGGIYYVFRGSFAESIVDPLVVEKTIFEKPLAKYSYKRLRDTTFVPSEIVIGDVLKEEEDFTSYLFTFFDTFDGEKKVSGLINVPTEEGEYPVLLMFRGFVDQSIFTTGEGTRRTAEEFARNGFITLAPDFLGYGESDMPSERPIEERFQTYTTALSLLASVRGLPESLTNADFPQQARVEDLGIWAHSNGGQIALSTLAVTGEPIPTVLWAPVTKPFPYNILYFTDEFDDEGKALRKVVSDFEKDYDVFDYSIVRYLDWIKAPMQLHQGSVDEAVPQRWSDQFIEVLTEHEIEHEYFVYPGENHNFLNGTWPDAMSRSIEFYEAAFVAETEE